MKKRRAALWTALLAFLLLAALSLYRLFRVYRAMEREQTAWEALAIEVTEAAASVEPVRGDDPAEPENAGRFAALLAQNADFAAWLSIPGTALDYPVMCCTAQPDFYLSHDFEKNESYSGTPYIAEGCDTGSDNILLHGHNMKNGTMFAPLLAYEDESFFRACPTIRFDTVERSGEYDILAVFPAKIADRGAEDAFRYYDYAGSLTEERYNDYASRCKAASLYDTGTEAHYGQQLLTLSTCAYHTENGRFVVVAVGK